MEGTPIMEADTLIQEPEVINPVETGGSFACSVQQSLKSYFSRLDGEDPVNLYSMVLAEMEVPLLRVVMRYTKNNQSKAAKILGLSRGTLRKKLAIYQIDGSRR
ncbi:Fis family transcriptional regulator [Coxiella endosymbiont of Ornithodoros amblus]|uniref:helix-turn-helix domain-containing protein n=1 Tax=Coxiella endosymbiont of Ornithodoros amblus TaxID=1656166 RepID=UPI00244E416F|nr:helix-turn-helix domain-containing protein [Coxiella endosymbiont of Ornithodoros amblus]MBW5802454.1 Fis family transcriptional regulator [Coxiella endosymbiont of Ornithodoros amblus]